MNINFTHLPFYIGKGTSDRAYMHMSSYKQGDSMKDARIKEIVDQGQLPIISLLIRDLTETQAFYAEALLIDKFKLVKDGGLLTNQVKPNVQKWEDRSKDTPIKYEFSLKELHDLPSVKYVVLEEDSFKLLSVHYDIESVAKSIGITTGFAKRLGKESFPYNRIRGRLIVKKSDILDYLE